MNELRETASQYNGYFNNKEVKDRLVKFDIYEQISRYGAEAFYDPTIYKDTNIEIKAVMNFGFEQIKMLDKLVYEIRNLLDFNKIQYSDNLKEILENEVSNFYVATSKISAKRILTLHNDYYKEQNI